MVRYLSAQDAVHHHYDEAFQRIKDSEEDLEECGAPVGDGQDGWHPGEGQEGQDHTGAPQGRPAGGGGSGQTQHQQTDNTEGSLMLADIMLADILYLSLAHIIGW